MMPVTVQPAEAGDLLRPYLESLDRELAGRVPSDERVAFLGETEFWLEHQINDYVLQGSDLVQATNKAVARHGSPKLVGDTLVDQWFESGAQSPLMKRIGRANVVAGTIFGFGNLVAIVLLQCAVLFPSDRAQLPLSPAVVRGVIPESLPLPETSWQFIVPAVLIVALPVVLGVAAGASVPVRAHAAVYRAMCPVLLSAFALGCLLLPNTAGLLLALVQTAFWLPVGCLAAHLTSTFARRRRAMTQKEEGSAAGPRTPDSKRLGAT